MVKDPLGYSSTYLCSEVLTAPNIDGIIFIGDIQSQQLETVTQGPQKMRGH